MTHILRVICIAAVIAFVPGCHLPVFAQGIQEKAFIVTHGHDTIPGTIDNQDWAVSPKTILFTESGSTQAKSYNAPDISGFGIPSQNTFFMSGKVSVKYYTKLLAEDAYDPVIKIDTDHVFMEILLKKNQFSLFKLYDESEAIRFVVADAHGLSMLENIEYMMVKNGSKFRASQTLYKSQLRNVLVGCRNFNFGDVFYTERSLVKLCKRYLSCIYEDPDLQVEQNKKSVVNLGFNAGQLNTSEVNVQYFGFSVQHLINKKFAKRFVHANIGLAVIGKDKTDPPTTAGRNRALFYFAVYGGQYIGMRNLRALVFTGHSNSNGPFDTGVGISWKKKISVTIHTGLIHAFENEGNVSLEAKVLF